MTKPSRLLSNGLDALVGSSLNAVESARSLQNPAIASGDTHASVPPATMTSASPSRMNRAASPTACSPVVHAVDTAWLGPYATSIERSFTCPALHALPESRARC